MAGGGDFFTPCTFILQLRLSLFLFGKAEEKEKMEECDALIIGQTRMEDTESEKPTSVCSIRVSR
jgi:hypothetical protein